MLAGLVPREIGRAVDPYDAYPSQFAVTLEPRAIGEHARLLVLNCLPRLIAGTELNRSRKTQTFARRSRNRARSASSVAAQIRSALRGRREWPAILVIMAFLFALFRLARDPASTGIRARKAVSRGTLASALLIVAAFLVNRNIYNSDNYRYLIFLLTPWALGFGLSLSDLARRGRAGRLAAWTHRGTFDCDDDLGHVSLVS